MTDDVKVRVKKVLDDYLEACQHRKTPDSRAGHPVCQDAAGSSGL